MNPIVLILIKVYRQLPLKGCLQFIPQIRYKLSDPSIILVILVTIADEDIVLMAGNGRRHILGVRQILKIKNPSAIVISPYLQTLIL